MKHSNSKAATVLVAAVFVFTFFYMLMREPKLPSSGNRGAAIPESTPVPGAPLTVAQGSTGQPASGAEPATTIATTASSLIGEFNRSKEYRVLYYDLLKRPAAGGGYYALKIVNFCGEINEHLEVLNKVGISAEQSAARQLLYSRCGSFTPDEVSEAAAFRLLTDPRLESDPLKRILGPLGRPLDSQEKRLGLVAEALNTGDPMLIESMAGLIPESEPGKAVKFNGELLENPNASSIISSVWTVAVCSIGMECGSTDDYVARLCALENKCFESRRAAITAEVKDQFGQDGVALFEKVYPAIVKSIIEKDVSILK